VSSAASHRLAVEARIPFAKAPLSEDVLGAITRVLESGWITSGPEVAEFEREFAAFVDAPFAVAVSSCTAAIELSLRALHLAEGSKVLCPTLTFPGVIHAIIRAGLQPVLVDSDEQTMMPDPGAVSRAVQRSQGVDAMIVLHFAGYPAPVRELADAAGLPLGMVIEDAAHALGTWIGDRPVGAHSAATCFSFYATKNLPIGEGGMVTTADRRVAEFVESGRLHGMSRDAWKRYTPGSSWRYEIGQVGSKANMTDIQAAIGRVQLEKFEGWQLRRREIADRYDSALSTIPGLELPARPTNGGHAWHLYVVRVKPEFGLSRDDLIDRLSEVGIGTSVHFIPVHNHSYFKAVLADAGSFPNADAAFEEIVSLPLYPDLTDEHVDRIVEAIASIASAAKRGTVTRA
jgi:perosamine synthetase